MKNNEEDDLKNQDEDLLELANQTANIDYMNNLIEGFELPSSLNDFRTQIKKLLHIESKTNDEIFVLYIFKEDDKEIEAKTDEDYTLLLRRMKNDEIKDNTIFIESDKVPCEISRKNPESFEEEIQYVIERELKSAADRIKKYLSGNKKCYPSVKNQKNKICSKCCRTIIGDIFKSVTDYEGKIYCEKCSYSEREPTFIIH